MTSPRERRRPGERPAAAPGPRFGLRFEDGEGLLSLARPLRFEWGVVDELELSLGRLRFPLDLSGGAWAFRSHRSAVRRARLRLDLGRIARALSEEPFELRVLSTRSDSTSDSTSDRAALALRDAFGTLALDLVPAVERTELWLVPEQARAAGEGPAPPLVRALAVFRGAGLEVVGARIRVERALRAVLAEALVPHGFRAPDDRGVRAAVRLEGREALVETRAAEGAPSASLERARLFEPVALAALSGDEHGALRAWQELVERGQAAALELDAVGLGLVPPRGLSSPVEASASLRAALREGDAPAALEAARRLDAVEPCHAVAVEALCAAADLAGGAGALDALARASARKPRDGRLALRLVEALARAGQRAEALEVAWRALAAREPGAARGELAVEAARVCELAGARAEASALWGAALEALPHDAAVLEGAAAAALEAGDLQLALARLDAAAAAHDEPEAQDRALVRASALAEAGGLYREAEARLSRARVLAPDALARLVRVRRALGASDAASRAEDRLLDALEGASFASDAVLAVVEAAARGAGPGSERARVFADALARLGALDRAESLRLELELVDPDPAWLRAAPPERAARALARSGDPQAMLRAALDGAIASERGRLAEAALRAGVPAVVLDVFGEQPPDELALLERLEAGAGSSRARAALARAAHARHREAAREGDAARALARAGAAERDMAVLRAAIAAADRSGDPGALRDVLDLALASVGEGPARAALQARRDRLDR